MKIQSEPAESGGLGVASRTLLAPIAWGTTYVTITELLPSGRPLLVASMRLVPAGLVLVALGWRTHRWVPRPDEWRRLAVLSVFNFALFFPLLIVAIYRLPGGVAAAIGGTQPLLVGSITWMVSRRRPRPIETLVGVAAATGVVLVVVRPGAGIDLIGVLAAVAANLSFSVGVVATKRLAAPPDRLSATGYQMLMSAALIVPLMLIIEGPPPTLTTTNLVGFAYLSLLATGAAFVVWFSGIRNLPTQAPPVLGLAAPITGAVLGWMVLGQRLSPVQLCGFAITITAIGYAATAGSRADAPRPVRPRRASAGRSRSGIDRTACDLALRSVPSVERTCVVRPAVEL